jgi:hypothetical protein
MGNLQDELKAVLAKARLDVPTAATEAAREKPREPAPAASRPGPMLHAVAHETRDRRASTASGVPVGRDAADARKRNGGELVIRRPQSRQSAAPSPIGLPRARNLARVDWWVKVLGPQRVRWALIERTYQPDVAFVYFVDRESGVFERWVVLNDLDAKGRLFKAGFERLQSKRALLESAKPPSAPFHYVRQPADLVPSLAVGPGAPAANSTRNSDRLEPMTHQRGAADGAMPATRKSPIVQLIGQPRATVVVTTAATKKLRRLRLTEGTTLQCAGRSKTDEHEVTIGLDFGTSATKVVIGDSSLSKAFAVPFCEADGVSAYLLPTRVHERQTTTLSSGPRQTFTLDQGAVVHRDLKLGWLANPDSAPHRERVVAFLALVLKHARGWLFHAHASVYKPVNIVWRVAVGLPAASALNNRIADELRKLAYQAWSVSCVKSDVDLDLIRRAATDISRLEADLQVDVVPEIAAQIYGFVTSHTFDRAAPNRYLLVDIGAGTVDSSLFRVKPARGRKWEFEFYTAVVQPHGASNLHVHRINWWQGLLAATPEAKQVVDDLQRNKFATDFEGSLPGSSGDYVEGVRVVEPGEACADPDLEFLTKRVVKQVRGETVFRAWDAGLLPQAALAGVPMFLCGGGSRMPLYQRIQEHLKPQHGYRWLHAERWLLGFPDNLECEGKIDEDYDRLSVAYGLSRLDIAKFSEAPPMPKLESPKQDPWAGRYVDKDQM